jgi:secreted trypsin-like serine protease
MITLKKQSPFAAVKLNRNPVPSSLFGKSVTVVGFGVETRNDDGGGTRKSARVTLKGTRAPKDDKKLAELLVLGSKSQSGVCHGDSGGPTFATIGGKVVQIGVHSYSNAVNGKCLLTENFDMDVSKFQTFIDQNL